MDAFASRVVGERRTHERPIHRPYRRQATPADRNRRDRRPLVGLAVGAAIAAAAFESRERGSVMVLIAAVVAGTLLALLWAGYSSLESPDPGHEPSDTERPIADREGLVREELGDPVPHGERRRATTPQES